MAMLTLFKNYRNATNIVLKDGTVVGFVKGRYFTTNKDLEKELKKLVEKNEAGVWIDPNEPEVDTTAVTPLEIERRKAVEEFKRKYGLVETSGRVEFTQTTAGQVTEVSQEPGKVTATPAAPVEATNPPPVAKDLQEVLKARLNKPQ